MTYFMVHITRENYIMVSCMAVGCKNASKWTKGISYHRLPKDEKLRKSWLVKINRANPTISRNSVLCSEHFSTDCYERNLKAELLGIRSKTKLKEDAVPTIFAHLPPSKRPRLSYDRIQEKKAKMEYLQSVYSSIEAQSVNEDNNGADNSVECSVKLERNNLQDTDQNPIISELDPTNNSSKSESVGIQVAMKKESCDQACQVNLTVKMLRNFGTQTQEFDCKKNKHRDGKQ